MAQGRDPKQWGSRPLQPTKFDRNAVELPRYESIEKRFASQARALVAEYQAGTIDRQRLIGQFAKELKDAETDAFVAGHRARGKRVDEISESEARMMAGRHSRNMKYFKRFVSDMDNGRGRMPYLQRADLYAKSLWSLYTRSESVDWDQAEDQNARYFWIMDPDAEHCPSCIERARLSRDNDGFTWEELSTLGWPGENTQCQVNCRCHIRTVRKRNLLPERTPTEPAPDPDSGLDQLIRTLGGEKMPVGMPAAGLPFVRMTPEALQSFSAKYPGEAHRYLPVIPDTLINPQNARIGPETSIYEKGPLTVVNERRPSGIWTVWTILFGKPTEGDPWNISA